MPGPKPVLVELTPVQLHELHLVPHGSDPRLAQRACIILLAVEGLSNAEIARREDVEDLTVRITRPAGCWASGVHDRLPAGRGPLAGRGLDLPEVVVLLLHRPGPARTLRNRVASPSRSPSKVPTPRAPTRRP